MTTPEVFTVILGCLTGIIGWLYIKKDTRTETDIREMSAGHKEDLKRITDRNEKIYESLIETQQKNTESTNNLAKAIDKLTITVAQIEAQSAERHASLTARINDNHDAIELSRMRIHWIVNKLTVLKMALEKSGQHLSGDWEAP